MAEQSSRDLAATVGKVLKRGCLTDASWQPPCSKCASEALAALAALEKQAEDAQEALKQERAAITVKEIHWRQTRDDLEARAVRAEEALRQTKKLLDRAMVELPMSDSLVKRHVRLQAIHRDFAALAAAGADTP